ncbi:MAG: hypothetical protein BGO69_10915 [Bacteroidetes bacterium 46-16]|nr:MAG: hypothetical protein BGO69_10915 [Bacteroidetes bacterium 46-16]
MYDNKSRKTIPPDDHKLGHPETAAQYALQSAIPGMGHYPERGHYGVLPRTATKPPQAGKARSTRTVQLISTVKAFVH